MLVIFDLDGTLLNSIADLAEAANFALRDNGYPQHSPAAYPYFVGNGVTRLLERVLPEDARTPENLERMHDSFLKYYNEHLTTHTRPYRGIEDLIHRLRENDIAIAVASNKYQEAVSKLIEHFFGDDEWAAVWGHRENMPVKPDPSIVFGILSEYPTEKAQVIYVGDSGVDMDTARRAGVTSVGVTWGFRTEQELRDHGADYVVNTPAEILLLALKAKGGEPLS